MTRRSCPTEHQEQVAVMRWAAIAEARYPQRRMVPRHAWIGDRPCPRAGAEAETAAPVNMASWPGRSPSREVVEVQPKRGLAALANVLPEVTP